MIILRTKAELRKWRLGLPAGSTVGFVPTMGALHEGHLSLVHQSRAHCSVTVASIFVNPLQFGPNEDLAKYPRPFERDRDLLEKAGCDALYNPDVADLYTTDNSTYVVEEKVSQPMCGEFRPGHFRGVATVVLKLFNRVQPDVAFFGQKDAQQCAVLERMVRDLDVPVTLVRGETVREADGLAMSSRNIYLSKEDRARATQIYKSLHAARAAFERGERRGSELARIGLETLSQVPEFKTQYWDVRHPSSLELVDQVGADGALFAVASYLGTTRLIDNLRV